MIEIYGLSCKLKLKRMQQVAKTYATFGLEHNFEEVFPKKKTDHASNTVSNCLVSPEKFRGFKN